MTTTFSLPRFVLLAACLTLGARSSVASAATLATATFDTDSYIFVGTNNEFQAGISAFTDYTGGVLDAFNNTHFNFGVIKFDNLSGIQTVANGGPQKYLTLETMQSGSGVYAFSVAGADVHNGYPTTSGSFNGPAGDAGARLEWYFDNIKGDDATYGGYAGGADHIGVLNVAGAQSVYSLDVTAVVDAWIDGTVPNYGFGLWAVSTTAAQGSDLDFASMENPLTGGGYFGPRLTSVAVPEPATIGLVLVGLAGAALVRRRTNIAGRVSSLLVAIAALVPATAARAAVIPVVEDVMTSSFFTGDDLVRGYPADSRSTFRVSTNDPFGTIGAETIYLTFNPSDFAGFTTPAASAQLTVQSKAGGFGADASAGSPFTVSAHGVTADPLTSIKDNTNPSGPINWLDFYNNNILPADPAALIAINGFGTFTFDVTSVVNSWIAGTNTVFALALTGKNHTAGGEFLHGFWPNNDAASPPNAMFLTVTPVPEPTALALCGIGLMGLAAGRRRVR